MSQEKQTAEEYVQKFIDSHEPDTFVKNEHGVYLYSAGHSSLNLKMFMTTLLEDYIEDSNLKLQELEKEIERLREGLIMAKNYASNTNVIDAIDKVLTNH